MTRIEKIQRIEELKSDLARTRQAIRDILSGKKQSYGIGSRNASAYPMSLDQLTALEKRLKAELSELEAETAGKPRRPVFKFRPLY